MSEKKNFSPFKSFGEVQTQTGRKVTGVGIRFGSADSPDFYGDFFTERTETGLVNGSTRPFLIEHWQEDDFAWQIVGQAVYEKSKEGWLYEATLFDTEVADRALARMQEETHRSSTGSGWNYTRGVPVADWEAYELLTWLVIEQSATIMPADFFNPPIEVKSLRDFKGIEQLLHPLLAERMKYMHDMNTLTERIAKVEGAIKSYEVRGVALPETTLQEVNSLMEFAKNVKPIE